ncbi:hypothetical protein D3C87_1217210 [compost metagenome]
MGQAEQGVEDGVGQGERSDEQHVLFRRIDDRDELIQITPALARREPGEKCLRRIHRVVLRDPLPRGADICRRAPDLLEGLQITGTEPRIVQHMHHVGLTVNAVGGEVGTAAEYRFGLVPPRCVEPTQDHELVVKDIVGDPPAFVRLGDIFQADLVQGGSVFARLRVIKDANFHAAFQRSLH